MTPKSKRPRFVDEKLAGASFFGAGHALLKARKMGAGSTAVNPFVPKLPPFHTIYWRFKMAMQVWT